MTPWKTFVIKNPKYPATPYDKYQMAALFFQAFVEFGWQLHDQVSATKAVYKSNGEGDRLGTAYLECNILNYGLNITPWYFWDEATHAGIGGVAEYVTGQSISTLLDETSQINLGRTYLSGNKDYIIAYTKYPYNGVSAGIFGQCPKLFEPDVLSKLTAPIAPGSNVPVNIESTAGFKVGQLYHFHSEEGVAPEHFKRIIGIVSDTQVIVDVISGNFNIGDWLGARPKRTYSNAQYSHQGHVVPPRGYDSVAGLTTSTGYHRVIVSPYDTVSANSDPAGLHGFYPPTPATWRTTHAVGGMLHDVGFDDEHSLFSVLPVAESTDKGHNNIRYMLDDDEPCPVSGTISDSGTDYIIDPAGNFGTDELAGRQVIYINPQGDLQTRRVLGNTATKITTAIPFDDSSPPVHGLSYAVVRNVFRCAYNYGVRNGRYLWVRENCENELVMP